MIKKIKRSKDLDTPGRIDIIGHGTYRSIEINLSGKKYEVNHRTLFKLIKKDPTIKSIRLMSCDTGADKNGFAQNLANKLNIIVEAPNKILWAYPNGKYVVASIDPAHPNSPYLNDQGKFIKFIQEVTNMEENKCEKCRSKMMPFKEDRTVGMRCPNCGWGWATTHSTL